MNIDHLRALLSLAQQEPVVICHIIDPALAGIVGPTAAPAVLLSWETVVKQKKRHPDIGFDEYCLIPDVVRLGMVSQKRPDELIFCYQHPSGRRFRLMIKATIIGELFVTSFHRIAKGQTKAILARSGLLRRHA